MFINTRAAQHVLKCIQENSCVTITASSGAGKTATLQYVALQMSNEEYDVIIVSDPVDIIKFHNPNNKSLFVIDDLCGNFSVDQSDIKKWNPLIERIKRILENKRTKIIAACRIQVFQDDKFNILSIFKSCVCNMLSNEICLSKAETQSIAELYLKAKTSEIADLYHLYDCFPLLCKMCHDNPTFDVVDLFQKPFSVYESEIDKLFQMGHYTKYCALALCVIFNNELKEEILTKDIDPATKIVIENTCQACKLDMDRGVSLLVIKDELDSLTNTYVNKKLKNSCGNEYFYTTLHDKIFDFLAFYFGQKITNCLIKNADSSLINKRFLLEKEEDMDQFITVVPQKYHQNYIQRLIGEWLKGDVGNIFNNINMRISQFRSKLLVHLKKLDKSCQKQLAQTFDNETNQRDFHYFWSYKDIRYSTAFLHCCSIGDIPLIDWCLHNEVDVNQCTHCNQSSVMIASEHGHEEIVRMLLDRGADLKAIDRYGQSSLMKACTHGYIGIVKMLVDRGADCNKCDSLGQSPVMIACEHGYTEIVKFLLDKRADFNDFDNRSQSSISKACEHGHTEIVKILIDRGANLNKSDNVGTSPLIMACKQGKTEIVRMLLDRKIYHNKSNDNGLTPLLTACEHGYTEIVEMLLNRGADFDQSDNKGWTPIMFSCRYNRLKILTMLVGRGALCEKM
ncbi:Hypothetical predicted protein [Mytilus galloprovincialis]|uniref:Novel STAND NTPase 3 domain-containing protein n=1 Tax=Mytilus galloprovincialis TaxID=29158 RepID=A0A8B6FD35_MYTGA|nr:Hypothetical predicted protein [Mytilus galloprovincialis]